MINTCLITGNVDQFVQFYESILELKAQKPGKKYAFGAGVSVLAIFSADAEQSTFRARPKR